MSKETQKGPVHVEPPPPPTISVRATRLRLAATCMATHDIRYYLNGAYIEPREAGGVFIICTDGTRMMAVIDELGSASAPGIISLKSGFVNALPRPAAVPGTEKIPNAIRRVSSAATIDPSIDNCRVTIETVLGAPALVLSDAYGQPSRIEPGNPMIEGKFPDWRRVMPDLQVMQEGHKAAYNYDYLLRVLSVFAKSRHKFTASAKPYHNPKNDGDAIAFHLMGHEYACLLIMPMRDYGREDDYRRAREKLLANWTQDARRPAKPSETTAGNPVAVSVDGGGAAQRSATQADAKRAAGETEAGPAQEGQTG